MHVIIVTALKLFSVARVSARRVRAASPQGHVQAIRQEGHEYVRFDPVPP